MENNNYTVAKFWKCALQVNPHSYIKYRGQDHGLSEEEYNQQLVNICVEQDIKVAGIAEHGNVDAIDSLRNKLNEKNIIVFPGFEIASSEKIHFVCLFPESTTKDQLNRYLGNLDLTDIDDGVRPTSLGANTLIQKVVDLGGFIYAAHITEDSGLLKSKNHHIWVNPLLQAAQIPGTIEELKGEESDFFRKVINNNEAQKKYIRDRKIGIINARDVEKLETLRGPHASCLIKMTEPTFSAFKMAFLDPESRVRLNSDIEEHYYSRIEKVSISGGYLDGITIDPLSDHLNTLIGGRGTGKSTLLESIRYTLEIEPLGEEAQKRHTELIKKNLGKEKAQVELVVRSSARNGKRFFISRRYPDPVIIKDESGSVSNYTVGDILPEVEIFGQNEILEIAENEEAVYKILNRFLPEDIKVIEEKIKECIIKLGDNLNSLVKANESRTDLEEKTKQLPKLQEEVKQFKDLNIDEISKIVPLLERERSLIKNVDMELDRVLESVQNLEENLPDTTFLSDTALKDLPHIGLFKKMRSNLNGLKEQFKKNIASLQDIHKATSIETDAKKKEIQELIESEEEELEKTFKTIPSMEGKTGKEIGYTYQQILKNIEQIRPLESQIATQDKNIKALQTKRKNIVSELTDLRTERSSSLNKSIKKLNKKLSGKLKITLIPEGNRNPLKQYLLDVNMEEVGAKRLEWVDEAEDLSPLALVGAIEKGKAELEKSSWGITSHVADALLRLTSKQLLGLEAIDLPDLVQIELNVHHTEEQFKDIEDLSTGQKCTALLHLLLLENKDPLLMDQPEDNLDNAFIAERIVSELRSSKIKRQFIFATHNANIPVFGDAEWIGILESAKDAATLPVERQGSIDSQIIRDGAANILEGGKIAFLQRKDKYGYK